MELLHVSVADSKHQILQVRGPSLGFSLQSTRGRGASVKVCTGVNGLDEFIAVLSTGSSAGLDAAKAISAPPVAVTQLGNVRTAKASRRQRQAGSLDPIQLVP